MFALLPEWPSIRKYRIPARIHEAFENFLAFGGFVAAFDPEVFDFAFVGFAQFVDLLASDGIAAGDGRLDALEAVEFEEVLCRVWLRRRDC